MGAISQEHPKGVIAVAASAGGVEALSALMRSLPAGLPAAVLIVLHVPPSGPSVLPRILERAGHLPVRHARDGEPLQEGVVLVAPPDRHLTVDEGFVARVSAGPRENGHRPSADQLFRSVAEQCGDRVAGVVLSGTMDDGAAGLRAVRSIGGMALVQDPEEAAFPGMPQAAIEEAEPQLVCEVREIGHHLVEWVEGLTESTLREEAVVADDDPVEGDQELSEFTCPECGGTLFTFDDYGTTRYRCRVGHAFSEGSLILGKQDAVEAALWSAIVALEEKADLSRRIVARLGAAGSTARLERYRREIREATEQARFLREMAEKLISAEHEYEEGTVGGGTH